MSNTNEALVVRINALCDRMDRDYAERAEERKETKEHREYVQAQLAELRASTEETRKRMDKVEPVANMVSNWRTKAAGAMMVLGFIGTVAWVGVTWFRDEIKAFIVGG